MPEDTPRSEELNRKIEELTQKAMEEESRRIVEKVEIRAVEMATLRLEKERSALLQELKTAEDERLREEEALRVRQEEIATRLDALRKVKEETQRNEREEQRRQQEEELRKRDAEEREKGEEAARRAAEEESRRQAEEQRRKQEEDLRRQEEEQLRMESEQREKQEEATRFAEDETSRKQEEKRKQVEEREARIRTLIESAKSFLESKEYENASVEIAKALVNDPNHAEARDLEQQISEALGKDKAEEVVKKAKVREAPSPVPREEAAPTKKTLSFRLVALIVLVAAAVAVVLVFQLKKRVFEKPPTFAVMPWKSVSGVEEENVLGSSLAEEVTKRLQYFPQLTVMGFSSAYGLSSVVPNTRQTVFRLGYDFMLTGTITRSETACLVEVRLADSLGTVKWANKYQKSLDSLQFLPHEISQQIAEAFKVPAEAQQSALAAYRPSASPEAYGLFLRGLELGHRQTDQSTKEALRSFTGAFALDEKFGEAYVAAANLQATRYERGWDSSEDALLAARHWAETAIDANNGLGEAHQVLGRIMTLRREYQSALHEIDIALQLEPNNALAYLGQAKVSVILGRHNDALSALGRAFKLSPRDPEVLKTFAYAYQLKGAVVDGFWYHLTALYFVPDSTEYLVGPMADAILFEAELSLAQNVRVADAFERRLAADPNDYVSEYRLARMEQVGGNGMKALTRLNNLQAMLEKMLQAQPRNAEATMYLALTLTRLGRYPEAVALANKALSMDANTSVKYRVAQMYSVQMYSQKKKGIDTQKKEEALKSLREAVEASFRPEEITNADFYNLSSQPEFRTTIAQKLQ